MNLLFNKEPVMSESPKRRKASAADKVSSTKLLVLNGEEMAGKTLGEIASFVNASPSITYMPESTVRAQCKQLGIEISRPRGSSYKKGIGKTNRDNIKIIAGALHAELGRNGGSIEAMDDLTKIIMAPDMRA